MIPVFANVSATRTCVESALRVRRTGSDSIVIVNDNPADQGIAELVDSYAHHPDVFTLRNAQNLGFVGSINRAMAFVRRGDVLLLNADTELFPGAIDEMHSVLHASPDVGTATALSSNATLFSYPHATKVSDDLSDISWVELAAVALRDNAGTSVSIPTAHGFCMLIRRTVADEVGFGVVFPFPIDVAGVMSVLLGIGVGQISYSRDGGCPLNFNTSAARDRMRSLYHHGSPQDVTPAIKPRRRKTAQQSAGRTQAVLKPVMR